MIAATDRLSLSERSFSLASAIGGSTEEYSAQILTYPHSALIGKANPDRTRAEQTET